MKRLVVIADLHCGHRGGLTPPDYQYPDGAEDSVEVKFGRIQRALWGWYSETIASLHPIDAIVVNGDAIDGKGERSGGTELIAADRRTQCMMAAHAIGAAEAGKVYIIRGTPYHVGEGEDWEDVLGDMVGADHVGSHEWVDVDGVVFDCKHKVGGSSIPHGRATAPKRAAMWNTLWAERGLQPDADVLIRSHVHYFGYAGDGRKLAITTPCLTAWSKYGTTQCEGTIDIGLLYFDVGEGSYTWGKRLMDMRFAAATTLRV